jgi:hypothetical protein
MHACIVAPSFGLCMPSGQSYFTLQDRKKCIVCVDIEMMSPKMTDEARRTAIFNEILKTLQVCPRAFLYFDEVCWMLDTTVSVLMCCCCQSVFRKNIQHQHT